MTSLVDAESVLAIDIGSINTRALLFDVVDGLYHFVSAASARSTQGAPFYDISEGVHSAITRLQEVTGRTLTGSDSALILPSQADGSGVDRLALTTSAGDDLNIVVMGLLSDVSMQSAQRLAGSTYGKVVETIGLNDRRRSDAQLDALLNTTPDVVIMAGGTEKGATRSVNKLIDLVTMASRILPKDRRPKVLYCGNGAVQKRLTEVLERETFVIKAPNIRPSIDQEDLSPAMLTLARTTAKLRAQKLGGLESLSSLSSSPLLPSAYAIGRMMRFSSELSDISKATLGIDLGANTTTMAVAEDGGLKLSVFRDLGMGGSLLPALQQVRAEDVAAWVPFDIPVDQVRDHLYQKSLYPASLPMTEETLAIEQAMARQILRTATSRMLERYPDMDLSFERIFISGAALANAPTPAQALMMVLDGVQPEGISALILDPYGLSQALGAIAGSNTLLPAQIIDSGAYINLGTVLCPVSRARPGTTIMKFKITYEDNRTATVEVKQGGITPLPISNGQLVRLEWSTYHGTTLTTHLPQQKAKVTGGLCGAIVDARGRPIHLPEDPAKRREQLTRWMSALEDRRAAGG